MSLVQMLGFHVWLEHFHSLSDTLLLMDNGRGWALSGCQTLKLVCTKQRLRRVWLPAGARWGFKRLILAMSWLAKCVEIICDSGQRVSCGRGGHTRLAHTSAPNQEGKEKKREAATWVTSAVDQAAEPVCGSRKAVKLTLRWFGLACVCVYVCEAGVFAQSVFPLGICV